MDPSQTRDPISLISELIGLLQRIADAGAGDKAAAAVGAVQEIAARSKEPAPFPLSPHRPATPSLSPRLSELPPSFATPGVATPSPPTVPDSSSDDAIPVSPADILAVAALHQEAEDLPHSSSVVPPQAVADDVRPSLDTVNIPAPPIPSSSALPAIFAAPPTDDARVLAPAKTVPQTQPAAGPKPGVGVGGKTGPAPRKGRNLIVCIDGTFNQFGEKNTNVAELYHRLVKDDFQLTYYNSGIGTFATHSWKSLTYWNQKLFNALDLAFAFNFGPTFVGAYLWLSENYREGDRIYFFGFSRGAYQVRALSAMIDSVGLLYKGNQDQIPFAYQLYAETKHFDKTKIDSMRRRFKETFSWTVVVELVAVWDTVSSVGLVPHKMLPGTTDGMKHVRYFRHALALHERRVKFLPENAHAGRGPDEEDTIPKSPNDRPHTKEVWFPGSHLDIGGGLFTNDDLNVFGPALRWISFEAMLSGVELKNSPSFWKQGEVHNSLTSGWKLFEWFPITRLTYRREKDLTRRLHLGRPRKIQANQLIHETALEDSDDPKINSWRARLPRGLQWDELRGLNLIEVDPYTAAASTILNKMRESNASIMQEVDITSLRAVVSTSDGMRSFRDNYDAPDVFKAALTRSVTRQDDAEIHDTLPTLEAILFAMEECTFHYADSPLPNARVYATELAHVDQQLAKQFLQVLSPPVVGRPLKHPSLVLGLASMPDGGRIISGCRDGAVRIWDIDSEAVIGTPMTGHADWVGSVAVSPDGKRIASGSFDGTIRIWSVETGATVDRLEGDGSAMLSVAFSPDGSRVVSGSMDATIRVWEVASDQTVVGPIRGHFAAVWSVGYSPDGSRIVSGSRDRTVRAWNAETGENVWQAMMSSDVFSVAYSPNGKQIVAGCNDGTVHVLDAETGNIVLGPLTGHTDLVWSVAFSPDGKRIASGSSDRTVRLWNAETGEEIDVFRGHSEPVNSVAFSPDRKRIASASYDKTVRIWDATGKYKL